MCHVCVYSKVGFINLHVDAFANLGSDISSIAKCTLVLRQLSHDFLLISEILKLATLLIYQSYNSFQENLQSLCLSLFALNPDRQGPKSKKSFSHLAAPAFPSSTIVGLSHFHPKVVFLSTRLSVRRRNVNVLQSRL